MLLCMKDSHDEFMRYYDERAPEYDEIYSGKGPSIPETQAYKKDVEEISAICRGFGRGHLIDIGCGTGYWLQYYARNCSEISLVDQSRNMLVQCKKRTNALPSDIGVNFIKGDFLHLRFLGRIFDTALIGFFISHLTDEDEQILFNKMKGVLRPKADILWIDGSWSSLRKKYREKEGYQKRTLNDGRSFSVFKRYFDEHNIRAILKKYSMLLYSLYMGDVFFVAHCALSD